MDREVKGEYQVLLQAKDMGGQLGGLASTTTINITLSDVNDNPPRFAKSKKVSTITSDWLIGRMNEALIGLSDDGWIKSVYMLFLRLHLIAFHSLPSCLSFCQVFSICGCQSQHQLAQQWVRFEPTTWMLAAMQRWIMPLFQEMRVTCLTSSLPTKVKREL